MEKEKMDMPERKMMDSVGRGKRNYPLDKEGGILV